MYFYTRKQKQGCCRCMPKCNFSFKKWLLGFFPIFHWLPRYRWSEDFLSDLVAGFTVAVMHIPQGMAYALLGGVPPIVGLYMAFFPVLVYVLMGTSRHVSMGTFAVVCLMSGKVVTSYDYSVTSETLLNNGTGLVATNMSSASHELTPIHVGAALCFVVGVWQLIMGSLHLGIMSVVLSETLVSGFTTGAVVQVLASQLKNLLGVDVPRFNGPLKVVYSFMANFEEIHNFNPVALGISILTISLLVLNNEIIKPFLATRLRYPLPAELLAVVTGTLVSMYGHLESNYGIEIVGEIPTGLPSPEIPSLWLLKDIIVPGLIIAIVAFSINLSMASIFAQKLNYRIDANQELFASGAGNVVGSFFSCLPITASLSRSIIQESVGGKSQLASLVSCSLLVIVLLWIGPFFEALPNCVLSSIIVVALKSMFMQVKDVPVFWRRSRLDGVVWIGTFLSVVLLDIDYGLGIGVILSLISVLLRGQHPPTARLGVVPGTSTYLDVDRYHAAIEVPKTRIFRFCGGLHFANKDYFRSELQRLTVHLDDFDDSTSDLEKQQSKMSMEKRMSTNGDDVCSSSLVMSMCSQPLTVVFDMSAVSFVDPSSAKAIAAIYRDLRDKNIAFYLAACPDPTLEAMRRCSFFNEFPENQVFPTIHDAVLFSKMTPTEEVY